MIFPSSFEEKIGFNHVRNAVKNFCISPLSCKLVDSMEFTAVFDEVISRLEPIDEMMTLIREDQPLPLEAFGDPLALLAAIKVHGTILPADDILLVKRTLAIVAAIKSFFYTKTNEQSSSPITALAQIASQLTPLPDIIKIIDSAIDNYGNILDNASPELAEIRKSLIAMSGTVNSTLRRVIARAVNEGLLENDTTPAMRDGRLVIPVPPMHKRRIRGIVHDESASGKTVFIEPAEVVEINNRIRETQLRERREIQRILLAVTDRIRPNISQITENVNILCHLDFITAKAKYAIEINANRPSVVPRPELDWYHACHPVLLLALKKQDREIIPLDIQLSPHNRILVISGPNAGGKSVCLKTVGIIQYMMQCGMMPPIYENSRMGIFTDIFVDIGDDQSIEDDLSTYSSHLRAMKLFVARGKDTSLFLIDEFGGGTEPQIGGAIAQAILQKFNAIGMWGVVTTHYQNLKQFAENTPGLINGSMLYDRHLMQPLFKLSIGNPGSSFAIEIARKTGLPADIIQQAEQIVGSDYVNLDKYLLDIARDRKYWDNKRQQIRIKEKKIDEAVARYENDAETLRQKRREILEDARKEARKIIDQSNALIEHTIKEIKEAQAEKTRTAEARKHIANQRLALDQSTDTHPLLQQNAKKTQRKRQQKPQEKPPINNRQLAVGDVVKLDGEHTPGKILEISGKNAIVLFGMLKTTVSLDRLRITSAQIKSATSKKSTFLTSSTIDSMRDKQLNFSRDIDLRGMRVDEAIQAVTYFIDDAVQFSADRVRILHGTGTGALRQAIREYLDSVPSVVSFHDEDVRFGGAGITIVEFE